MSNTETATSLKNNASEARGPLVIVRAKDLAAAGTTGTVAEGVYEGTKFKPAGVSASGKKYGPSTEYRIRGADDTLYILNETKAIKDQLGQLTADDNAKVRVNYNGLIDTKAGKSFHDFEVFVISAS